MANTTGIEPKTLEKKGYSRATIYSYNRKLPAIRKRLDELLQS